MSEYICSECDSDIGDGDSGCSGCSESSEKNIIGYALRNDNLYHRLRSDGIWVMSPLPTVLTLRDALKYKDNNDDIVNILDGGVADEIACKVKSGIVSWWRIGDALPMAARTVVELRRWNEKKNGKRYACIDAYGYLGLTENRMVGAYDILGCEVVKLMSKD